MILCCGAAAKVLRDIMRRIGKRGGMVELRNPCLVVVLHGGDRVFFRWMQLLVILLLIIYNEY